MGQNCQEVRERFENIVRTKAEFDSVFDPIRVGAHGYAPSVPTDSVSKGRAHNHAPLQDAKRLRDVLRTDIATLRELLVPKEFRDLQASEALKLKTFFKEDIVVPKLPPEVTREMLIEWEKIGLKLHYLPRIDMATKLDLEMWTKKPSDQNGVDLFEKNLTKSGIEKVDGLFPSELPGAWILVDTLQKPTYTDGSQMYETQSMKDPLGPALKHLRDPRVNKIKKESWTQNCPEDSRFGLSHDELSDPQVREAFHGALKLTPKMKTRLLRAIEFNVLAQIHGYPWGDTDTWEWFEDRKGARRLYGGDSDSGGLSNVGSDSSGSRNAPLGFRFLGCFSTSV